jgi:hypothetical protein
MPEPTRLIIFDNTGKEIKVVLDSETEERLVYINLGGKELLLPANWALSLAQTILITARQAIDG